MIHHLTNNALPMALLLTFCAQAGPWPTYRYDSRRSGVSPERLRTPLHRQWTYSARHKPRPAWSEPGGGPRRLAFDYAFDVTYTTVSVTGTCSASCYILFPDDVYPMGYSPSYGMLVLYFDYHGEVFWYPWYYAEVDGNHIDFWWDGYGYSSSGYWDVDGDSMTGQAVNEEP